VYGRVYMQCAEMLQRDAKGRGGTDEEGWGTREVCEVHPISPGMRA